MDTEELLLGAFTDALIDVRDVVVERFTSATATFSIDPGELYSDVDWTAAMIRAGVPEAVATNIVAAAASTFGFENILEAGFTDVTIEVAFEGSTIRVTTQGLKGNFSAVVTEHVDALGSYSSSIQKTVQETVDLGIRNGTSVDDIGRQLFDSGKFSERSAEAFAQTETVAASNGTSYAGYPEDFFKEWIYTHDDRVRPTHEQAGKEAPIPMKSLFTVGSSLGRYPGAPELPPAERIWCFPGDTNIVVEGDLVAAYRFWFDGELVEMETASGFAVSGSVNHPIQMANGSWVALGDISEGDDVLSHTGPVGFGSKLGPVDDDKVMTIEDVFEFVGLDSAPMKVSRHSFDFHGDVPESDVDVVFTNGCLGYGVDAETFEFRGKFDFPGPNVTDVGLSGKSLLEEFLLADSPTPRNQVGGSGAVLPLVDGHLSGRDQVGFPAVSELNFVTGQESSECGSTNVLGSGDTEDAFTIGVSADQVTSVRRIPFTGHLFNLSTSTGRYSANGIVVHNCRCTMAPVAALAASGGSIEMSTGTSNNISSESTCERFTNMSDKKTVTLTIRDSVENGVTDEAVNLSEATRNCDANKGGTCCDDCKTTEASNDESFETVGAETFAEDDKTEEVAAFDWEGVLTVEGMPSGDGRQIAEGALEWRNLPLPFMLQTKTEGGHRGAEIAGSIAEIERVGQDIIGRGYFDSGEAGQEAKRLVVEGTMAGVSVDLDLVAVEYRDASGKTLETWEEIDEAIESSDDPYAVVETVVSGRIMGVTATPFPAFQEAQIKVLSEEDAEALVASGATASRIVLRVDTLVVSDVSGWSAVKPEPSSLVASASFPAVPPVAWFGMDEDGDVADFPPFTVYPDGRCFGVVAEYGSCHIGFGKCVTVPKPWDGFSHVCNKTTMTDDGLVPTGPIYMNTVHPELALNASDAETWYADTGAAVADVTLWDTDRGIVACGAVRPSITEDELRTFRGSDVSPDWRQIKGQLTMVGLLGVNVSGFIVERDQVLVASAGSVPRGRIVDGEMTALVAAGVPARPDRLEELEALYAELVHNFNVLAEAVGLDTSSVDDATKGNLIHIPTRVRLDAHSIKLVKVVEGDE